MAIVRVWQDIDLKAVQPYLLIAGNVTADCGNCGEIGLSFDAGTCPKCGTRFKYAATRILNSTKEAKRIKAKRPDLTVVEFQDVKASDARKKAHGLLGGIE